MSGTGRGAPVEQGIAGDIPDRGGGGRRIEMEALKEGWRQRCGGFFLEWTEVGAGFGRAQEVEITEESVSI